MALQERGGDRQGGAGGEPEEEEHRGCVICHSASPRRGSVFTFCNRRAREVSSPEGWDGVLRVAGCAMVLKDFHVGDGSMYLVDPERLAGRLEADAPEHFVVSETARAVLEARYLRERDGRLETPREMLRRVARHVAAAERNYGAPETAWQEVFYLLMLRREFLPNSPTLMNAGAGSGQLAACFVLPTEGRLADAVQEMVLVQRTGGGTGFDFSQVLDTNPVAAIERFDRATETVRQEGLRRGANLAALRIDHPAVVAFVAAKAQPGVLENFNLSLSVPDAFMEAVQRDEAWPLVDERGRTIRTLSARRLLRLAAAFAWATGDPGLLFIDRINEANPVRQLGEIRTTNPCGELPLLPYEACNLGSINLSRFVQGGDLDWDRLADTVHAAVRFLDDVIDVSRYPLEETARITRATRKIGLGVMGFADMLVLLKVPYASEQALTWAERIMAFVASESVRASEALARERGPFPAFSESRFAEAGLRPRRNATLNTVAPTGSISILAGCSSGIEPIFALALERRILEGRVFREVHPLLEPMARAFGVPWDRVAAVVRSRGTLQEAEDLPTEFRDLFRTALEIPWEQHLGIQAAFQRHVDNSVSKTVNLPNATRPEEVFAIFLRAFQLRLKGVTVFRDGCREEQVLAAGWGNRPKTVEARDGKGLAGACPICSARLRWAGSIRYCEECAWCEEARPEA